MPAVVPAPAPTPPSRLVRILRWVIPVFLIACYFSPFEIRYPAPVSGAPVMDWGGAVCERRLAVARGWFWEPRRIEYCVYRFSEPVPEPPVPERNWSVEEVSPSWSWRKVEEPVQLRGGMLKVFGLGAGDGLEVVEFISPERIGLRGDGLLDRRGGRLYVRLHPFG